MTHKTIKDLARVDQPYERLEAYGAHVLTNAELLAIIIKSGSKNKKAIDVAASVLNIDSNGLIGLHQHTLEELKTIEGVGRVKAIQLKALAELSIRMSKTSMDKKIKITSPGMIAKHYMEQMRHLGQEQLRVVLLDTKNHITKDHVISVGTVDASYINPREILVYCLKHQCVSFILIHNHPSGDPTPSQQDLLITERIATSAALIGIHLLDHVIIGDRVYISLKQEGYMTKDNQEIL